MQDPRRHTEPDAQMPLGAELHAWHDHRAVLADQAIDQRHRVHRVLVAEETDRTGRRRCPVQHARMCGGPVLEEWPPFVDEKARALKKLLAPLERDLSEALRECRGRDRGVVLYLDRRLDALAGSDDPPHAQARKAVDLG